MHLRIMKNLGTKSRKNYFSRGKNQLCSSTQELWPWTGRPKTTRIPQFIQCSTGMTSNFKMWLGRVILARFLRHASRRTGYGWTLPSKGWKVSAWPNQVSISLGCGENLTSRWIFPYILWTKIWYVSDTALLCNWRWRWCFLAVSSWQGQDVNMQVWAV